MLRNRLCLAILAGLTCASAGCTMCPQSPEDYTYAAYGGLIQRADMMHGRVGSAFSPAEAVPSHGNPHEGSPLEIVPAGPDGYASAYQGPVLMPPQENGGAMTAADDQSQATATAFDPGDILSSGPR